MRRRAFVLATSPAIALGLALSCVLLCGNTNAAEGRTPGPGDQVLFTFVIFGDNKTGGNLMDTNFANMKKIAPSFYIGMGDHFTSRGNWKGFEASMAKAFGSADAFYRRFYLTAGDNEAGALGGSQSALGSERPFFYRAGLFDKKTDKPGRNTLVDCDTKWLDYYAQLCIGGVRLHLVNLYDQDSIDMQKETVAFGDRICERIKKAYPGEPFVVMAHDGNWWKKSFKNGHAIYSCDLLLGASWHAYRCLGTQGGGTCMAFNTSAVGRGGESWYAVMVCRDKLVLLNIDDKKFAVKGKPGCHVKPFGKPGFDGDGAAWFKKLTSYGQSVAARPNSAGSAGWGPEPGDPASFGYKKLGRLAKQAGEQKALGSLLGKLKRFAAGTDKETAAEAKKLRDEILKRGKWSLAEAGAAEKDDPARAIRLYESVKQIFKGHEFADKAKTRVSELKRDPKVRKELRAMMYLGRVRKAESMLKGKVDLDDAAFVRRNQYVIAQIVNGARSIAKRYPDTKAAQEANTLSRKYSEALKGPGR